jgi:pyruvate kinase
MRNLDKSLLEQLSRELASLCGDMLELENSMMKRPLGLHEAHQRSARNLAHYLALRRHDIRELQAQLALLGLSSLGRTESHVLNAVQTVHRVLNAMLGRESTLPSPAEPAVEIGQGAELLEANADALLGPPPRGRKVRIMVTMGSDAATDYELVRDLVRNGMDCMRINCAHDNPDVWLGMIHNLERAREETGRPCRVLMDVAGPKLRTGRIEPGPEVVKCRPLRDVYGRVVAPARIWLTPEDGTESAASPAAVCLPLKASFLKLLRPGDKIRFRDARKAQRTLRIAHLHGSSCWAEARQTVYFVPGLELQRITKSGKGVLQKKEKTRIGKLPSLPQTLLLKEGDTLVLKRESELGRPAVYDKTGQILAPAQISVSIPEILDHAKVDEPVWFDDGKIGGVIRNVDAGSVAVEITQARPEGQKLGAEKGINLPETRIDIPALTPEDLEALKFIVQHADLVGYSFVRTDSDVQQLLEQLAGLGGQHLGLILKVETRKAFDNLPKLILAAMRARSFGIMIARGDLAVECGYQRLAEVQEEILWICEAAHVPVIWATQVLESLAKKGLPSRSEITDAAMGERAECVMLNKGPYAVTSVRVLADILKRMQAHQEKKRSMLRQLRLAAAFSGAD